MAFTLDREPDNKAAIELIHSIDENYDPKEAIVTTIAIEKQLNTFFRLNSPTVIARLRDNFPDLSKEPAAQEVFLRLRGLRNSW